jgi:hypothetical protein
MQLIQGPMGHTSSVPAATEVKEKL